MRVPPCDYKGVVLRSFQFSLRILGFRVSGFRCFLSQKVPSLRSKFHPPVLGDFRVPRILIGICCLVQKPKWACRGRSLGVQCSRMLVFTIGFVSNFGKRRIEAPKGMWTGGKNLSSAELPHCLIVHAGTSRQGAASKRLPAVSRRRWQPADS